MSGHKKATASREENITRQPRFFYMPTEDKTAFFLCAIYRMKAEMDELGKNPSKNMSHSGRNPSLSNSNNNDNNNNNSNNNQ